MKITLKNIFRFVTGYSRWFRYTIMKKLLDKHKIELSFMPEHKIEQFKHRLEVMNKKCLIDGKCVECGCHTPQLQMVDESCERNCYPAMMNKEDWNKHKKGG